MSKDSEAAASEERHVARMRKLEDSEQAAAQYGLDCLYMHLSALSPTTRKSHAERHGKLFTAAQMREFWSDPDNVEGCQCGIVVVRVDAEGKPTVPLIVERAKDAYVKWRQGAAATGCCGGGCS